MGFFDPLPLAPQDSAVLARLIGFLRGSDPAGDITRTLRLRFGPNCSAAFYPKDGLLPAWAFANVEQDAIALVDGVSTQEQATAIMEGYAGVIQSGARDPSNSVLMQLSRRLRATMDTLTLFSRPNLTLCGWSAGGAICPLLLVDQPFSPFSSTRIRVVTFGAPRCGGERESRIIQSRCTAARYMAFDDPIPNFPPRSGTFTWVPFVVGIRASVRFANFVHHFGGLVIDGVGNVNEATVPTHGDITPRTALAAYWNGLESDAFSAHSLNHYATLLDMQATYHPYRTRSQVQVAEHTQNTETAELERQLTHSVSAVRELQGEQESQRVRVPPQWRARAIRQGRVFYVVMNNTPLMMTPTRRRAQGLARDLNAFLKRNQSTAYVDPVALTAQINLFLQAASDASSGIQPTLNTEIPL